MERFIIYSVQLITMSWIRRIKRGNKFYLYECTSERVNGKVKYKMIRYLGVESDEYKVPKPISKRVHPDKIFPDNSLQAGDVTLLWEIAERLGIVNTIDWYCLGANQISGPTPGKYLTAWAINRIVDPESATQLDSWVRCTTIPDLARMKPEDFSKDSFLRSLDSLCTFVKRTNRIKSNIPSIEGQLYQNWRQLNPLPVQMPETMAFDLTAIPTFGETCPFAELGSKAQDIHRNQINLSILASKYDTYPISQFVHPGSFNSISTINDLVIRLKEFQLVGSTIVWDRGYTTKDEIIKIESEGWKLICGVTKRTKMVRQLISETNPPLDPDHLVRTQEMNIYAEKIQNSIFKTEGAIVVYVNVERKMKTMLNRNITLKDISLDLDKLKSNCSKLGEKELTDRIQKIIGKNYKNFFEILIFCENNEYSFEYAMNEQVRVEAEKMDGKYMLYATDSNLSSAEIVQMYFEKDFVEKVFRDLKSFEEIGPIRHRLETRVTAILFVCSLALRIKVALRTMMKKSLKNSNVTPELLLKKLSRVQKIEMWVEDSKETWFVNIQKKTMKMLEEIGFDSLFNGKVRMA